MQSQLCVCDSVYVWLNATFSLPLAVCFLDVAYYSHLLHFTQQTKCCEKQCDSKYLAPFINTEDCWQDLVQWL